MKNIKIKTLKFIFLFSAVILLIWLISIAVAPYHKLNEIQKITNQDSSLNDKFDNIYYHNELESLIKDKIYKESLLKLSENDSIHLAINLVDSTVNLSIKGIFIHQAKIANLKTDKFWNSLSIKEELKLFSRPLMVQSIYTTIVKEPVVVREAPKDTLEASLNAWKPDTLIQNPAYIMLQTEYNFRIIIEQFENEPSFFNRVKLKFRNHLRFENLKESASNFLTFRRQEYIPTIIIELPTEDIRSIYRAIPTNTLIAIKM
ncbi:hypothetical protein [Carboxylicivirga caseinilyticus]|uniref:hypothetical protein n=1 Tax=Carboxylicivirga caseinilyticus TaxID=3417572 RepID=UPI003D34E1FE|nr:hypothetical protein [Marinilabiliaceae bacterium A049]